MLQKAAALLLPLLLLFTGCTPSAAPEKASPAADRAALTVLVCPDLPPMAFAAADGTLAGAEIRLAESLAASLALPLTLKPVAFSELFDALARGEGDLAIASLGATDARAASFLLSDPYNLTGGDAQVLLVRASDASAYTTAADFAGKTVLAQEGSVQMMLLAEQSPDAITQAFETPDAAAKAVLAGEADALASTGDAAKALLQAHTGLAAAPFRLAYASDGNVIAVRQGEEALLAAVNEALAAVNAEGLFETWLDEAAGH